MGYTCPDCGTVRDTDENGERVLVLNGRPCKNCRLWVKEPYEIKRRHD